MNRTRYASDYKRTCLPIPSLCTCYKQAGGSPQNTKTGNNTSYILHCLCQLEATNKAPTKHAPPVMQIKETTSVTDWQLYVQYLPTLRQAVAAADAARYYVLVISASDEISTALHTEIHRSRLASSRVNTGKTLERSIHTAWSQSAGSWPFCATYENSTASRRCQNALSVTGFYF